MFCSLRSMILLWIGWLPRRPCLVKFRDLTFERIALMKGPLARRSRPSFGMGPGVHAGYLGSYQRQGAFGFGKEIHEPHGV